ncbi:S8 family serine peptidase [Allofustis seminis]|uniref:S8 family serine peptidase n=1 Tax=Allofustis seminis TaxID=166939 RepID=UPI0003628466|nr:S8 family serine peptidase [Allofustis seminis]
MNKKRLLATVLASSLILSATGMSTLTFAVADAIHSNEQVEKNISEKDVTIPEAKEKMAPDFLEASEKSQRVIVELSEDSVLDKAVSSGKLYDELEKEEINETKAAVSKEQAEMLETIKASQDISADLRDVTSYDTSVNAISFNVKQKDIEKIEKLQDVKNVYLSQEFERPVFEEPAALNTEALAIATGNNQYKGEGTVVAVIDSGIDYTHEALKLDEGTPKKLDKEKITELSKQYQLKGNWLNEKVPYGYNYFDHSPHLFDRYGMMHGMHVSGIVGSNNEIVTGVASKAQILSMKVFSDDVKYPTTFTDVWLKALDDAIRLGADVVNMSLGAPAGFSYGEQYHPEKEIFEKARKAGIVIAVAAGNEGNIMEGYANLKYAYQGNYDTGVIANPALNEASFAVAAMESEARHIYTVDFGVPRLNATDAEKLSREVSIYLPRHIKDKNLKQIDGPVYFYNKNETLENEGKDPAKMADANVFIESEDDFYSATFKKELEYIAAAHPKSIVIYNNQAYGDDIKGRLSPSGKVSEYPVIRMKRSTFQALKKLSRKRLDASFKVNLETEKVANAKQGQVNIFSSWGPTPDLRIKPEITSAGGNVYSLAENNQYQNMSGTSMASPQVAGASAVIKQYLNENSINYQSYGFENVADFIKNILMNAANPIEKDGTYDFVRRQGAGALDLEKALNMDVIATITGGNDTIEDGKLELKQINEKVFTFKLKLQNFGKQTKTYIIKPYGIYEEINGDGNRTGEPKAARFTPNVELLTPITIAPNETFEKEYTLDFSNAAKPERNDYLEGFITLEDQDDHSKEDVSLPFLAFYGDWTSQKALDAFVLPEIGQEKRTPQFYTSINCENQLDQRSSAFVTRYMIPLPIINNTIYFSPDATYENEIAAKFALLRNMESIEYSILDGDTKEELRTIGKSYNVRKLNRLAYKKPYMTLRQSIWDGKIHYQKAQEDKDYIYQMKVKLNNNGVGGSGEQIYQYPVKVDSSAPEFIDPVKITDLKDEDDAAKGKDYKKITFSAIDKGTGIQHIYLQSIKYVDIISDKQLEPPVSKKDEDDKEKDKNKDEFIENPIDDIIDHSASHEISTNAQAPEEKESATENVTGSQKIRLKKYLKHIKITLLDSKAGLPADAPQIEDGKLVLDVKDVPDNPVESGEIFVYRNGFRNKELKVEMPFLATSESLEVTVLDYLSFSRYQAADTGAKVEFNTLNFINYKNQIQKNNATVKVNDEEITKAIVGILGNKAKVEIKMPDDTKHLDSLYLKNGKDIIHLIYNDSYDGNNIEKYHVKYDEENKVFSFIIDPLVKNYEIITTFKPGKMPKFDAEESHQLHLSKELAGLFRKVRLENKTVEDPENITITQGSKYLMFFINKEQAAIKDKELKNVYLKTNDRYIRLPKKESFDIEYNSKIGYKFTPNFALAMRIDLDADAELILEFSDQPLDIPQDEIDELEKPGLGTIPMLDHLGELLTKESDYQEVNNTKEDYPIIMIHRPDLLSLAKEFDIPEDIDEQFVAVEGYIGHVKEDDKIKQIKVAPIDEDGNPLGDEIIVQDKFIEPIKDFSYTINEMNTYHGDAYRFTALVEAKTFNLDIRVEVETEKGYKAAVVRSTFFDNISPELQFEVQDRALDSDYASVILKSSDNSLKVELYHDDSLVESIDKTQIALKKPGVTIQKQVDVKLQDGLNKLKFSSTDFARNTTEKIVYIYKVPLIPHP